MLNSVKKGLIAAGVVALAAGNAVAAPLTAADINIADTTTSIGVVFLVILGVTVLIFGFKKILGIFGK